jgi:hypothetical protein
MFLAFVAIGCIDTASLRIDFQANEVVVLGELLCGDYEVYDCGGISTHANPLLPSPWIGKNGPLDLLFGQNIKCRLPAQDLPALVPGDDLVLSGWNIRQPERPAFIRDSIVGMRCHEHLGIHPNVSAVTFQVNQSGGIHIARNRLILEREGKVISGCAVHVNGVKRGVRALHLEYATFGNQQNMRFVAAEVLVQGAPAARQVKRFPTGDALNEHYGIGDAALRANNQALKIASLLRFGIANLRIFGDGKAAQVRFWS